jgi:DNA-binding transcriptional LysR family regulator
MHDFLATTPFDLYELSLFHLVAKHRSFTKAAELAGLTQSAITRQMQGMEQSLGIDLMERTTRSVRVTPAGEFLLRESARLLGDVEATLDRLKVEHGGARKVVRVGVSQSVSLAYLPGFFHANLRHHPETACRVSHQPSADILSAIEAHDLDLGVICPPRRLPRTLMVTHRFDDAFTLIAPAATVTAKGGSGNRTETRKWLEAQSWLLIGDSTVTGQRLRQWIRQQGWSLTAAMELDSFDLIINLVALGMGVSFVPIRALALYGSKRTIQRLPLRARFEREMVVLVRRHRKQPEHLARFVENVLF